MASSTGCRAAGEMGLEFGQVVQWPLFPCGFPSSVLQRGQWATRCSASKWDSHPWNQYQSSLQSVPVSIFLPGCVGLDGSSGARSLKVAR